MANDTYTVNADGKVYAGMFAPSITAIGTIAAGMVAGDIVELTTFTGLNDGATPFPNEGGSNDLMQDWCVGGIWDAERKRAYVIGSPNGKLGDGGAATRLLIYDAIADHWFSIVNPINFVVAHCYDNTAYHNGKIYKMPYSASGGVRELNADTFGIDRIIAKPSTSIGGGASQSWVSVSALCVVPTLGDSGSLIMLNGNGKLVAYDFATDTWSFIAGASTEVLRYDEDTDTWVPVAGGLIINNSSPTLHYNATSGKLVAGCSGTSPLYLIDVETLVVRETQPAPINIFLPGTSSFVESPNSINSICYGTDGNYHVLNTLTGTWTTSAMPTAFTENPNFALQSLMVTIPEYDVVLIEYYSAGGDSRCYLHKPE